MKFTFYHRVLLMLSALLLLVQLVNLSVVLTTIGNDVKSQLRNSLTAGTTLVAQLAQRRVDLLQTSAEVLAADFGFRSTIASGDTTTIQSALDNNLDRIDADLATFITLQGQQIGNTTATALDLKKYQSLLEKNESEGISADTLVLDGIARQVVVVPIKAPLTIGWLVLGFSLDSDVAQGFSNQVGMHVTFAKEQRTPIFFGSSLTKTQQNDLPLARHTLQQSDHGQVVTIENYQFLTARVTLGSAPSPVVAVLHTSLSEAMDGYYKVRLHLLYYMALSLVLVLGLGSWFAKGVTRPVKLLAAAAVRIRNGDYQTVLTTTLDSQRGDEFGQLIGVFDEMQLGIAEREATILHKALFDELTELPNLRHAQDVLSKMIAETNPCNVSLLLFGINRYRQIVETLGYAVGESVIKELANRLKDISKDTQFVARISTDEFLLICPDLRMSDSISYAETLIKSLTRAVQLDQAEVTPDVSAGVIGVPEDADNTTDALRRASIALAGAREKNLLASRYKEGTDEIYIRRLSIVADLKIAVKQDQLLLHFQPKINMSTGATTSVEALVRWIHPVHGFMAPDEFIGLAEQSGNIGMLSQWVLNAVIAQVSTWNQRGIHLKAAVNLSALDLQDESLLPRIEYLLDTHKVAPTQLIVEVTESAMLRDTQQALTTLKRMRSIGITISIDDFGTGYSSLAKLKDLPIDELKIDRAFVIDIEPETPKAKIIKAIIDLGHSIGLTVITEGVETQAEWDLLDTLGNDVVQGYLISKPLPAADFEAWWIDRYPNSSADAA